MARTYDYTNLTLDNDVIVPEIFAPYYMLRTMEKSAVLRSGIATQDALLQQYASGAGTTYHIPHFNDLGGDDERQSEGGVEARDVEQVVHRHGRVVLSSEQGFHGMVTSDLRLQRVPRMLFRFVVATHTRGQR